MRRRLATRFRKGHGRRAGIGKEYETCSKALVYYGVSVLAESTGVCTVNLDGKEANLDASRAEVVTASIGVASNGLAS